MSIEEMAQLLQNKKEQKQQLTIEIKQLQEMLSTKRKESKGPGVYEPGKYDTSDIAYSRWKSMINRCYNPRVWDTFPTYEGCTVCDEWLYFQSYAEWFYTACPGDPSMYDVDKDLLCPNNKIYSPETCEFLPRAINILVKNDSGNNKYGCVGVHWDTQKQKFRVRFEFQGKKFSGGYYTDLKDAQEAYVKLKKEKIRKAAQLYKDCLSQRAFDALMTYEPRLQK